MWGFVGFDGGRLLDDLVVVFIMFLLVGRGVWLWEVREVWREFGEVGEEVGGHCLPSLELVGGCDGSGSSSPFELCVGCGRGWDLDGHCNIRWNVESFPGTFEFNGIALRIRG